MDIHASARYVRMAPRKVRLVARLIVGKSLGEALDILRFTPRAAAGPMQKLLKSAEANAKNNFSLEPEALRIVKLHVDGGPVMKRYWPRAHGSADVIRKKSSHVHVVLREIEKPKKQDKKSDTKKEEAKKAIVTKEAKKPAKAKKSVSEKVSKRS